MIELYCFLHKFLVLKSIRLFNVNFTTLFFYNRRLYMSLLYIYLNKKFLTNLQLVQKQECFQNKLTKQFYFYKLTNTGFQFNKRLRSSALTISLNSELLYQDEQLFCQAYDVKFFKPNLEQIEQQATHAHLFINFNNYLICSTIENLLNSRVLLCFKVYTFEDTYQKIDILASYMDSLFYLKNFFFTIEQVLVIFLLAMQTKDVDFLLMNMKLILQQHHFSQTGNIFYTLNNIFTHLWEYCVKHFNVVGLHIRLAGKLSRHLLTQARSEHIFLGVVGGNSVDLCVIFRQLQTSSRTGAYGLELTLVFK